MGRPCTCMKKISVLSAQFCCKPNTALKLKSIFFKKKQLLPLPQLTLFHTISHSISIMNG